MSGYQIGPVTYTNFGPFKHAVIDFSVPGLTCLEAVMKYVGCDSNGAGKSMLFDGIPWVIFDRCIREKYRGENLRRGVWDEKKQLNVPVKGEYTCVSVPLIGGPEKIVVERYRNHPTNLNRMILLIDGHDRSRGTDAETLYAVEQVIGMDFTTFCNTVAFGVREDVKSFFSATDNDRKQVMDTILGMEIYAEAEKVARRRCRKVAEELSDLESDRTKLETRLAEKNILLQNLDSKEVSDATLKMQTLRLHLKRLGRGVTKVKQDISDLKTERRREEERHKRALEDYESMHRAYSDKKSELERKKRGLEDDITGFKSDVHQLGARFSRFRKLDGQKCPTCEQEVDGETAKAARQELQKQMDALDHKIQAMDLEVGLAEKQLAALEEPSVPVSQELETLDEEIGQERDRRKDLQDSINVAEARLEEIEKAHGLIAGQVRQLKDEIAEAQGELDKVNSAYNAKAEQVAVLEFWTEGYGSQGVRSFLIEAELPAINRWATKYAQRLLGKGTSIKLSPTTKLKSRKDTHREKISIECLIPGCTNSYEGASAGQKRRLNLCLLLAFWRVVSSRSAKSFNQLFVDELFDGLDPTGAAFAADLLREISTECPVTLVTHDPRIKPVADRVITVHHNGTYAVLEDGKKAHTAPKKLPKKKKLARVT